MTGVFRTNVLIQAIPLIASRHVSQTRQATLAKHGFVCRCPLCDLDRQDGTDRLEARRRLFAVTWPALATRSDALLSHNQHSQDQGTLDRRTREAHADIREALTDLDGELAKTYATASRGPLRPETRETLERIGQHAACEGLYDVAVCYLLRSLLSVGAILSQPWQRLSEGRSSTSSYSSLPESDRLVNGMENLMSRSTTSCSSDTALLQSPALHVDEAQRTLWRLSQLFLSRDPAVEGATPLAPEAASMVFSRTAYRVHEVLIGGGLTVFRDRWGPVNEQEAQTLAWKDAWNLWYAHAPGCRAG